VRRGRQVYVRWACFQALSRPLVLQTFEWVWVV
jgi:hypothetical protein